MSLKRIVLRDFVIVRELELDLADGFTVLTGETGAGKSILIDALQLATGGRADVDLIREGATRAEVSAEFDNTPATLAWLQAGGFDADTTLLMRRTIDAQGKSRAWINGSPATATQLRTLGEALLDIHGQHAWQSLTRPDTVRALLDAYAKTSTHAVATAWQQWQQAQAQLSQAQLAQDSLQGERERLLWQLGELEKLSPGTDEWPALNAEHTRLSHAQALLDAAQAALAALDGEEGGVCLQLGEGLETLQKQEHIEPVFKGLTEVFSSSLAQLQDTAHTLRVYLRKTELDPQRLQTLDDRMALWLSLARRYKRPPEELPALLASWKEQLQALDAASDLQSLHARVSSAWQIYQSEADALTAVRRSAAPRLAHTITEVMQELGMHGGQFQVQLDKTAEPMQFGQEEVRFLVAGHAGSAPRAVAKVASGGELSRLALAIAVTTSRLGTAQTLIFDEVDAGIGGAVAETVGRLMRQLGQDRQVLAVTHLPQVAACADHHWVVSKQMQGPSTLSSVTVVSGEQRVDELARMMAGERILASTLAHARDLLQTQASTKD
ncbi:MAG: DNA repair protein RecN [Comamonadaceae bacterium CG1_02_60_18]|nr:MAG: DNA repair protein RecN [Comamonadaceae bacterium CG1_02_60_18]PIQ53705.1 MAG: DNA repair protein RecN [Comamonadaceae bacterium CG12_big_fil_rev_8_21_14_0_65_59_15]